MSELSMGSRAPIRWYSGIRGCGVRDRYCCSEFAGELGAEVMAEVVRQEIGAVGVVAVEAVGLAEGVVDGGVEGAGGDERAERRDRLRQAAALP